MKTNRHHAHMLILCACLILGACASQTGGSFRSSQTRTAHTVIMGEIIQFDAAFIDNDASGLGAMGGAVVGGVAGNTVGAGRGRVLSALGGAVIGGLVGTGIERSMSSRDAIDVTVRLENGRVLSIVQEMGDEERSFRVGDRVRILCGADGSARVRR